jgi:hypothetical protein
MGKINNYTVVAVKPGDKIICSDADTGDTKNITAQEIIDLERSSNIYRAYLTQASNTAPVATLIPGNTITGSWVYDGTGTYIFTSIGAFANVNAGCIVGVTAAQDTTFEFYIYDDDSVILNTYAAGVMTNGLMTGLYVEIVTHTN